MKPNQMPILSSALADIQKFIGSRPAESGGILMGSEDDYVIRKLIFDVNAKVTRVTYSFNVEYLNPIVKRLWEEEKLSVLGFIHSHPNGFSRPSSPDMAYFKDQFQYIKRKLFYTPIVFTKPDGGYKLFPYILHKEANDVVPANVIVIADHIYIDNILKTQPKQPERTHRNKEFFLSKIFRRVILCNPLTES